jgi:hypothetical protein
MNSFAQELVAIREDTRTIGLCFTKKMAATFLKKETQIKRIESKGF